MRPDGRSFLQHDSDVAFSVGILDIASYVWTKLMIIPCCNAITLLGMTCSDSQPLLQNEKAATEVDFYKRHTLHCSELGLWAVRSLLYLLLVLKATKQQAK